MRRRIDPVRFGIFLALLAATGAAIASLASAGAAPRAQGAGVAATRRVALANPFLTSAMHRYLATRTGDVTAALVDLHTGAIYLYRPGIQEQTASIVKVDILATLLREMQVDHAPLSSANASLATQMIEDSNDDDATALWNGVGGAPAIARFDRLVGMNDTAPNTAGYWGETMTTALDQVRLLKHLVSANAVLDPASRAYELGLMRNVVGFERWGVSSGPPAGVSVALKNGWVPIVNGNWQINSIGDVNGDGRAYLLAVLTNENGTEGYGITTISGVSRLIWSELAGGR